MADNVAITAGSGTTIATDEVNTGGGNAHVQLVKLLDGADGGTGRIGGDATNGLDVDVTRLPAGENFLGFVGAKQKVIDVTFARPANTTAYAIGDAVSDSTSAPTILTFSGAARANGGSGIIIGAMMIDSFNQTTKGIFELALFDQSVSAINDNSAVAFADADAAKCIGVINFGSPYILNTGAGTSGNVNYPAQNLGIPFTCGGSSDDIFGQVIVRNAYTPGSAEEFTLRLWVIQH